MSYSETITRTDLANILNEVLPPVWGMVNKVKTLTATTDANGNVSLGLSASAVSVVVCVIGEPSATYVYAPFVYGGNWYAKVMSSDSSHTSIRNTSVSIVITYLVASYASVADYIVEQGTSGIWTYRKWNSGIAEVWMHTSNNVAINNSYGSLYQGTWNWDFPFTFTSVPTVTCSQFKWGTGASWGTVAEVTTSRATLRGIDVTSRASGSAEISAYAIGRWK